MNNKILTRLAVGLAAVVAVLKLVGVYHKYANDNGVIIDDRPTSNRGAEFNVPSKEYTDLLKSGDGFISYMRTCNGSNNTRSILNYVRLKNPDPNRHVFGITYKYNTTGEKGVPLTSVMKYLDEVSTEHYYQSISNGVAEVLLGQNSEKIMNYTVPTSQRVLENNFGVKLAPDFCKSDDQYNNRSLHSTAEEYITQSFNMAHAGKDQVELSQDEELPNRMIITLQNTSKIDSILAAFYETMPVVQEYFYTYTTKTGKKEVVYGIIFERKGVRIDYSYINYPGQNPIVKFGFLK